MRKFPKLACYNVFGDFQVGHECNLRVLHLHPACIDPFFLSYLGNFTFLLLANHVKSVFGNRLLHRCLAIFQPDVNVIYSILH